MADKGIRVIPTVNWGLENTFDFCFNGIEKGSTVAVSTYMASAHGNRADQKDFFIKKLIRLFESKDDRLDMQKKAIELSYQYSIDGAFNLWQELFSTLLNSK